MLEDSVAAQIIKKRRTVIFKRLPYDYLFGMIYKHVSLHVGLNASIGPSSGFASGCGI